MRQVQSPERLQDPSAMAEGGPLAPTCCREAANSPRSH